MSAFEMGVEAWEAAKWQKDNPFNPVTQPDDFDEWAIGYMEAEHEPA